MKKITLFVIAFLGFWGVSEAQVNLSLVPRVGASWGNMSFTNQLTSHVTRYSSPQTNTVVNPTPPAEFSKFGLRSRMNDQVTRVGITGGLGLNIAITENFSVQPELLFVQKGSRYINKEYVATTDSVNNLNQETTIKLNYIELPIVLRYDFSLSKNIPLKGYLSGGLSVGAGLNGTYSASRAYARDGKAYEMTEEGKIKFGAGINTEKGNTDRAFDTRFDYAGLVGFGLQYEVGAGSLVADVRYSVSINNLYKKGSTNIPVGYDNVSKNRVAQITLGYMLPIGGSKEASTPASPATGKKKR